MSKDDEYMAEINRLEGESAHWRSNYYAYLEELQNHRDKARGNYWAWQGDGTDHLESLTCPVLIAAADLRRLLSDVELIELDQRKRPHQAVYRLRLYSPRKQRAEMERRDHDDTPGS